MGYQGLEGLGDGERLWGGGGDGEGDTDGGVSAYGEGDAEGVDGLCGADENGLDRGDVFGEAFAEVNGLFDGCRWVVPSVAFHWCWG